MGVISSRTGLVNRDHKTEDAHGVAPTVDSRFTAADLGFSEQEWIWLCIPGTYNPWLKIPAKGSKQTPRVQPEFVAWYNSPLLTLARLHASANRHSSTKKKMTMRRPRAFPLPRKALLRATSAAAPKRISPTAMKVHGSTRTVKVSPAVLLLHSPMPPPTGPPPPPIQAPPPLPPAPPSTPPPPPSPPETTPTSTTTSQLKSQALPHATPPTSTKTHPPTPSTPKSPATTTTTPQTSSSTHPSATTPTTPSTSTPAPSSPASHLPPPLTT